MNKEVITIDESQALLEKLFTGRIPVTVSVKTDSRSRLFESIIIELHDDHILLTMPLTVSDLTYVPSKLIHEVTVTHLSNDDKYVFTSESMGVSDYTTSGSEIVEVLSITRPERIEKINRRSNKRINAPMGHPINAIVWSAENDTKKYHASLVDLTCNGIGLLMDTENCPEFRVNESCVIQFVPIPHNEPIIVNTRHRHSTRKSEGKHCLLGFQIIGLGNSIEDQNTLKRIHDAIDIYQLHWKLNPDERDETDIRDETITHLIDELDKLTHEVEIKPPDGDSQEHSVNEEDTSDNEIVLSIRDTDEKVKIVQEQLTELEHRSHGLMDILENVLKQSEQQTQHQTQILEQNRQHEIQIRELPDKIGIDTQLTEEFEKHIAARTDEFHRCRDNVDRLSHVNQDQNGKLTDIQRKCDHLSHILEQLQSKEIPLHDLPDRIEAGRQATEQLIENQRTKFEELHQRLNELQGLSHQIRDVSEKFHEICDHHRHGMQAMERMNEQIAQLHGIFEQLENNRQISEATLEHIKSRTDSIERQWPVLEELVRSSREKNTKLDDMARQFIDSHSNIEEFRNRQSHLERLVSEELKNIKNQILETNAIREEEHQFNQNLEIQIKRQAKFFRRFIYTAAGIGIAIIVIMMVLR